MTNLEINKCYVGLDEVDKVYLGVDVVWQPASSGGGEVVYIDGFGVTHTDRYSNGVIPDEAYGHRGDIVSVNIGSGITSIGYSEDSYVFASCENLSAVTIGPDVEYIGGRAFEATFHLNNVTIPASVTQIDTNAFYNFNPSCTIVFEGDMPSMSMSEQGDLGSGTNIIVPDEYLSNYCSFLGDYDLNVVSDQGNNCYGDPMFWEPLTMVIQDPGSGSTTGLMWRLSGASSASEVSQSGRSIYYTLNDGPLTLVEMTGTPTTSKTVDVVIATGLSQGDVFRFYGASSAVGSYGFASGGSGGALDGPFHYFVNYAGMQAVVLGNIKSLLTDKANWDDMAQLHDKQAIDNIPMNDRAFMNLFQAKTGLTFNYGGAYLVLPDRNLSTYCFKGLFNGCTRMTTAPELPATALTDSCYREMFFGCTSLTSAPALPAETLAANCYRSMFNGCTSLTAATTLPALSVPDFAYLAMFADTRITTAPALPATNLSASCYSNMFRGCTRLTNMPELPATTLAASCYASMFSACTRLTTAPELPATTLANYCYQNMFQGCTSLTTAPELPATTLGDACYYQMFRDCTNLTTAPALPATTLANSCYRSMFQGCQNLNYIKCLATNISAGYCTSWWVDGVASTGTFVKNASMSNWTTGTSGIPDGWTIIDAEI